MVRVNNKSGFTLLEILVVIIIVGVLASVAMPTLFKNVERARSAEALNILGTIKRQIDGCAMQFNGDSTTCNTFDAIGMTDPTGSAGSHFGYGIAGAGQDQYTITATRNTADNGVATDTIVLTLGGGAVTRAGTTAFTGLQ
jgi:type IV pilus assembly protein PilE